VHDGGRRDQRDRYFPSRTCNNGTISRHKRLNGLLIIGAGGHGKVVADTALLLGWNNIGFLDDRAATLQSPLGLPIVGTLADLAAQRPRYSSAIVAIGNATLRLELTDRCRNAGLEVISLMHPMAYISRFASIGAGCVAFAQSAVNADARIGAGCIVNTGATIDHDCVIGDGVHVCPGAHLAGAVNVGDRSWIGIAATVRQGISIGRDATVGAGAAVVADVADASTVVGVPAKHRASGP
jgi:sugar O-acyltransferase (sialic acid O-acetyltransferase NeuD family)